MSKRKKIILVTISCLSLIFTPAQHFQEKTLKFCRTPDITAGLI